MTKTAALVLCDLISVLICLIAAYAVKYDDPSRWLELQNNFLVYCLFAGVFLLCSLTAGCYSVSAAYPGLSDALRLLLSAIAACTLLLVLSVTTALLYPPTLVIMTCSFLLLPTAASRFFLRIFSRIAGPHRSISKRRIILAGLPVEAREITERIRDQSESLAKSAILFSRQQESVGTRLGGVRVAGGPERLEKVFAAVSPDEVIFSKTALGDFPLEKLVRLASSGGCRLRLYTGLEDYPAPEHFRELTVESLLERSPAVLETAGIEAFIRNKRVLVTGGAGSIGSELCMQALRFGCEKLLVFDICENTLFSLGNRLSEIWPGRFELAVGSIRDEKRLDEVFSAFRPDIVFHAAAHKHVPMMESNPGEAVKNNIFGTLNTARAAQHAQAGHFILISTDKAVHPSSIMGATKRAAEMLIHSMSTQSTGTVFAAVRFGNVLGSNGSVVPRFEQQIRSNGPVTVTHPDVTRYFMTIPEAVQLVMQAGAIARGGEIFLLDMGEPVRIADLADKMIRLSGFEPGRDIRIVYTGLRPGEKLTEELSRPEEDLRPSSSRKIFICTPEKLPDNFMLKLDELRREIPELSAYAWRSVLKDLILDWAEPAAEAAKPQTE